MDESSRRAYETLQRLEDNAELIAAERAERAQWQFHEAKPQREVVHKTEPNPAPQPIADLSPEVQARWDAWLDRRVMHILEIVMDVIGEEEGAQIKKLKDEIAALRVDIEILRAHKVSKDDAGLRGNVSSIVRGIASDVA